MSCSLVLNLDNSITVEIELSNPKADPTHVNDAVVTCAINDSDGLEVKEPFALPYVVASDGVYRETITPVNELVEKSMYTVTIHAVGSDGIIGNWDRTVKATKA